MGAHPKVDVAILYRIVSSLLINQMFYPFLPWVGPRGANYVGEHQIVRKRLFETDKGTSYILEKNARKIFDSSQGESRE